MLYTIVNSLLTSYVSVSSLVRYGGTVLPYVESANIKQDGHVVMDFPLVLGFPPT